MKPFRSLRPFVAAALAALLPAPSAQAAEVAPADAGRAAKAWVDRGYAMGKLPAGRAVAGVDEIEDPATGARLLVAKFEGGGFVVLSADDLVDPVLAFSETGDGIDPDENNPGWILLRADIAAREAAAGVARDEPATTGADGGRGGAAPAPPTEAQRKWADLLSEEEESLPSAGTGVASISDVRVDSFIQSSWNQKTSDNYTGSTLTCYNYYTPNNYYCGCTATATAQIMRYYRFPTGSVSPKTWSCKVDNASTDKTMMGGVYAWDDMPLRPWESTPTEAQRQAIGKLCYDVGVAACMNWKSGGSSASIHCAAMGLREDFGYASAVSFYYNSSYPYSLDEFKKAVTPSLDAKAPVVLDIYNSAGNSGHAILADGYGYSGSDFFLHLNFGWGSRTKVAYNIWYVPPNLKPSDDHPYDTIRGLVCNVFPDKSGNVMSGRVLDPEGTPLEGVSVSLDGGATVTTDSRGVYAFVTSAGAHTATATRSGSSASVSATLPAMVPTRFVGRPSNSYYPASCTVGNSGNNDIVLAVSRDTAPTIGTVSAGSVAFTGATVSVPVTALGDGSSYVDVAVTVGGTTKTQRLSAPGTASLSFTGLSAGTSYTASVAATGSNGLSAAKTVSFTTAAYTAPTLGAASVSGVTQTGATVSVPVTALGAGSSYVDVAVTVGSTTKTQRLTAAGTASLAFDGLSAETTYTVAIAATGSNGKAASASASFATASLVFTGWFDVRWTGQAWGSGSGWLTAAGQEAAGGRFAVPAGDASSLAGGLLALALPEGGQLRFTACEPSAAGGTVKVEGTLVPSRGGVPDPATGALAGLSFTSAGYLGWNGTRWVALSGAAPTGALTAWTATFDFTASPAKVRYAAGGTVLTADGQAWIPLATSRSFVSGVGYRGGGSVGDFRAVKSGGLDVPVLASPALDGVEPLELSGSAVALRVNNAVRGAWYTVYASETVDGTYRAVKSVSATSDGVFAIGGVPAGGDTLFLRVGVSDASVPAGTAAP